MFGNIIQQGARRAAPFMLASLIYHWDYLKETLPVVHPLWHSSFGQLTMESIRTMQTDITLENDTKIKVSGIPVSVKLLQKFAKVLKILKQQTKVIFFCFIQFHFCFGYFLLIGVFTCPSYFQT